MCVGSMIHMNRVKLNSGDKAILNTVCGVTEGIAKIFGESCEVVVHSLEDIRHSVIKIVHGHVTGRQIGSPLTDLGVEMIAKANTITSDVIGSYYSRTDKGKLLKCVTVVIRNSRQKLIGFLCINIDLSAAVPQFPAKIFSPQGYIKSSSGVTTQLAEHFPSKVQDLISDIFKLVVSDANKYKKLSLTERNKMVVLQLYQRGVFNIKGAVDFVAAELGVSRYTVYNHIREAKVEMEKV